MAQRERPAADNLESMSARMRGSKGIPDLMVESAMVNPQGKKARLAGSAPNDLLNLEWVQLRNMSDRALLLNGVELRHLTYKGGNSSFSKVFTLQGQLPGKCYLRIHSGRGKSHFEAARGIFHAYVNPKHAGFYYQIVRNDTIAVVQPDGVTLDQADYYVPVPEGRRLKRVAPIARRLLQPV